MIHFVVAGTFQQFQDFVSKNRDGNDYRYVNGPETLFGVDDAEFHYVGTYDLRKDLDDVMGMIFKIQTKWKDQPFHISLP